MKLTAEQKDAFARANAACRVCKRARGQWVLIHPWRDIDGPTTETAGAMSYFGALQCRVQYVAFYALLTLGYDGQTADWATSWHRWPDSPATGRALQFFKAALAKAGPLEATEE